MPLWGWIVFVPMSAGIIWVIWDMARISKPKGEREVPPRRYPWN